MAYEQKENSGSLFKNDKKKEDNHPNATGSALIGGVEFWVSAWTKKDKNGNPWQSLSFRRKDDVRQVQKEPSNAGGGIQDMDDDIPF